MVTNITNIIPSPNFSTKKHTTNPLDSFGKGTLQGGGPNKRVALLPQSQQSQVGDGDWHLYPQTFGTATYPLQYLFMLWKAKQYICILGYLGSVKKGSAVGIFWVLDTITFASVDSRRLLPFFHNHGSVKNYPPKKETKILEMRRRVSQFFIGLL